MSCPSPPSVAPPQQIAPVTGSACTLSCLVLSWRLSLRLLPFVLAHDPARGGFRSNTKAACMDGQLSRNDVVQSGLIATLFIPVA